MDAVPKDPGRLKVLKRIDELEQLGLFDHDVEDDPPWQSLDVDKIDFLNRKLSNKIKTKFAYFFGHNFYKKMLREKEVIFKGATGLEHLKGYQGGAIFTSNHFHQFDNFAILLGLRKHFGPHYKRFYKIVREGNYSFPGMIGFFIRHADTLPIGEGIKLNMACMKAVDTLLKRQKTILIYPEQGMWWNYRKPRPLKQGAFLFAAKSNIPIYPIFITLRDSNITGKDGFKVQEYTVNFLAPIYPDARLSVSERASKMKQENYEAWVRCYETTYQQKLTYLPRKEQS
jgi:1-acyl-sn-glycerol-3-phosphate acyltransferase